MVTSVFLEAFQLKRKENFDTFRDSITFHNDTDFEIVKNIRCNFQISLQIISLCYYLSVRNNIFASILYYYIELSLNKICESEKYNDWMKIITRSVINGDIQ